MYAYLKHLGNNVADEHALRWCAMHDADEDEGPHDKAVKVYSGEGVTTTVTTIALHSESEEE